VDQSRGGWQGFDSGDRAHDARTGLARHTPNTLADISSLTRELEGIRRDGFAFDNEEAERGVSCIGAGIHDDEGRLVAGLSVSAPSDRLNRACGRDLAGDRFSIRQPLMLPRKRPRTGLSSARRCAGRVG